jgi:hypothetical protein
MVQSSKISANEKAERYQHFGMTPIWVMEDDFPFSPNGFRVAEDSRH